MGRYWGMGKNGGRFSPPRALFLMIKQKLPRAGDELSFPWELRLFEFTIFPPSIIFSEIGPSDLLDLLRAPPVWLVVETSWGAQGGGPPTVAVFSRPR